MLRKVTITNFVVVYDDDFLTYEQAINKEVHNNGLMDCRYKVESVNDIKDIPPGWRDCEPWGGKSEKTCRERLTKEKDDK